MTSVTTAWPFYHWGINIVGSLPPTPEGLKFLIIAAGHFTKWVEAKPLASTTGRQLEKIAWEHTIC
ncbi:reverse transcriptase domain-containing protein, partial [Tanacetum coccineum]